MIANWGSGSVRYAPAHGHPQPVEAHSLVLNCEKARQQLGWRPRWGFEEAVRQTITWYRDSVGAPDTWKITARQIESYAEAATVLEVLQETA